MSPITPKPGSFLPYLEFEQRNKQASPSVSVPSPSPIMLLDVLARQVQRSLPMADLQTLSGMEISRYRDALKSLRDAGYVTIEGPSLDEVVRLTDKGSEAALLARPS